MNIVFVQSFNKNLEMWFKFVTYTVENWHAALFLIPFLGLFKYVNYRILAILNILIYTLIHWKFDWNNPLNSVKNSRKFKICQKYLQNFQKQKNKVNKILKLLQSAGSFGIDFPKELFLPV